MNYFTNKYQQFKQYIMKKSTKSPKPAKSPKVPKPIIIKEPSNGFPATEKDWVGFAKKNKVKHPFFCVEGLYLTMRTSDGKPYLSAEQFEADGGLLNKIQGFRIKK